MAAKRYRETSEYAAFVRRVVRAYGRRVSDKDIEALGEMAAVQRELDTAMRAAVAQLQGSGDYSWADIGRVLGITRQAAQQRYGKGVK
jgi:hypothetical protein